MDTYVVKRICKEHAVVRREYDPSVEDKIALNELVVVKRSGLTCGVPPGFPRIVFLQEL